MPGGQPRNRLNKRFLEEAEGVGFEPAIRRMTDNGFRDRLKPAVCRDFSRCSPVNSPASGALVQTQARRLGRRRPGLHGGQENLSDLTLLGLEYPLVAWVDPERGEKRVRLREGIRASCEANRLLRPSRGG